MRSNVGALGIASVTAVLKDVLGNSLLTYPGMSSVGDVSVSTLPPDRITTGVDERSQLNLFMYRMAPHSSLSQNVARPRQEAEEKDQGARLRLDLYYLLTAYGAQDYHSEILLGCAIHLLNSMPVLSSDLIREALGSSSPKKTKDSMTPARAALSSSDLANQIEQIRITPQFLSFEEMSKLWSALQARYRPSVAYEVSAVTIQGRR